MPSPSWIIFQTTDVETVDAADGQLDRVDESVQIDCFADSEAKVKNLQYEVERLVALNREDPNGVGDNIFSFLWPGGWTNNDALNQAEGLLRRTTTVTLIRHRGRS